MHTVAARVAALTFGVTLIGLISHAAAQDSKKSGCNDGEMYRSRPSRVSGSRGGGDILPSAQRRVQGVHGRKRRGAVERVERYRRYPGRCSQ
jgi:hypothetical protein